VSTDFESSSVDPEPGPLTPGLIGLVGIGGAVGTGVRYAVNQGLPATTGFPWSTFAVNLFGTLILGVLLDLLARRGPDTNNRRRLRLLVGTGVCGGLTTYSTFAVEVDLLIRRHCHGLAAAYAIATVIGGLAAAAVGISVAARMHRRLA
jgi:CrcB protein